MNKLCDGLAMSGPAVTVYNIIMPDTPAAPVKVKERCVIWEKWRDPRLTALDGAHLNSSHKHLSISLAKGFHTPPPPGVLIHLHTRHSLH
ncbi:hypothetical protein E2C01_007876 [Portunus trituberculatus]|uniref:Uncharacterized protein n=1 Tax=Portunus trituberculatus TaxID=210409 RepID=A0A5B7D4X9_PORTR|nr:hypothetical protein [Portunus trituberculatus]